MKSLPILIIFYAIALFTMNYFIPDSSNFGWLLGIICGRFGDDICRYFDKDK